MWITRNSHLAPRLYTYLGHTSAPSDVQEFLRHNSGDEFVPIEPLFPATIL